MNKVSILLITLPLVGVIGVGKVQAQITQANDGTGTTVTTNNNQTDITGGRISNNGNGTNQFHSLTQFNVDAGKTANFEAANGNIRNILTRVTGGNVSKINGKIQVTGGNNPNLFLMNPAGFIFGNDAKNFNLPGSLTVTTANGIGFNSGWFNATGSNNYDALTGNPTAFAFTMDQPGAIINSGDLSVKESVNKEEPNNLTLLGGTVVNTGTLKAPNGQVIIAAVPGKNIVRISQQGNLLSLDIESTTGNTNLPNNWTLPIQSLPQLLTGGDSSHATGVEVKDGNVVLTGSDISVQEGDVVSYNTTNSSLSPSNFPLNLNLYITSKSGNIKTDQLAVGENVVLSAENGNIEVDTIFAGTIPDTNELSGSLAGNIDIKAGGFFRAIKTEEATENTEAENPVTFFASITVANPASLSDPNSKPFISIKTKNQNTPDIENPPEPQPGDGRGRVKIEVGSEFFVVGDGTQATGSFQDNQSGTIGTIAAQTNGNQSSDASIIGRTFGTADPTNQTNPETTIVKKTNEDQEQSQTTTIGILSLDESLVALLKNSGHATELTISNDGEGELKGSDFNIDDEEEFEAFNFDRNLLHSRYVFYQK